MIRDGITDAAILEKIPLSRRVLFSEKKKAKKGMHVEQHRKKVRENHQEDCVHGNGGLYSRDLPQYAHRWIADDGSTYTVAGEELAKQNMNDPNTSEELRKKYTGATFGQPWLDKFKHVTTFVL